MPAARNPPVWSTRARPTKRSGELRQAGYFPTHVYEEGATAVAGATKAARGKKDKDATAPSGRRGKKNIVLFQRKTVKPKMLMIFTRQLATLIDAGLPLLRGLNVLAKQERDSVLKNTINKLADSVQGGSTFSEGLAQHPRIFNDLYVNMVKAGELGGVLELVLTRLAEFQEKAQKIKNKVVAAMVYPVIVLVLAMAIMRSCSSSSSRNLKRSFTTCSGDKPLPGDHALRHRRQQLRAGAIGRFCSVVCLSRWSPTNSPRAPRRADAILDRVKLRAPLFGDLIRKTAISRFSRTLGTLVTSGVPILQALTHHARDRRQQRDRPAPSRRCTTA